MDASSVTDVSDGAVLTYLNKRLRALRKKYNRILQMEESRQQGKVLNKEQEEVVRSKPAIAAQIEEHEKLRQPLTNALKEELELAQSKIPSSPSKTTELCSEDALRDLLSLLYFGNLFDVKPQSDFTSTMLTRTHERECCLTYDYVTDDATDLLGEQDLDLISSLGSLLIARPLHSTLSHKHALHSCFEHAKLWLTGSDQLVQPGSTVTYASLRQRLNKILASDYFTTAPEMRAPVDVVAAAGKYIPCQVTNEDQTAYEEQEEDTGVEPYDQQTEVVTFESKDEVADESSPVEEPPEESDLQGSDSQGPTEDVVVLQGQSISFADSEEPMDTGEMKEYAPRRSYYNQRGGARVGGRRGYANGRGGRRGGGYQNGRSQYYDSVGHYPRNFYGTRGRGGGRFLYNQNGYMHSGYGYGGTEVEPGRS